MAPPHTPAGPPPSWGGYRRAGGPPRAGMPREQAELAAYTLLYYVLGHTVDEQSRMQMDSAGALPISDSPEPAEGPDPTARFDFGLQLFTAGIRHRLGAEIR